jgi:hypothetical protein
VPPSFEGHHSPVIDGGSTARSAPIDEVDHHAASAAQRLGKDWARKHRRAQIDGARPMLRP